MGDADVRSDDSSRFRRPILALAGALSLCCLFAAPATGGVAGGTAAGTVTAAAGGGVIEVAVTALTVGLLGVVWRRRSASADG